MGGGTRYVRPGWGGPVESALSQFSGAAVPGTRSRDRAGASPSDSDVII